MTGKVSTLEMKTEIQNVKLEEREAKRMNGTSESCTFIQADVCTLC